MKEIWSLFITFCHRSIYHWRRICNASYDTKEITEERQWATEEEVIDFYAIGQCTPGIIAVNTATMIGYKERA